MGAHAGPDINENGLVLALDAASSNSILSVVDVLVVGGGGGGGGVIGGGGGGGGFREVTAFPITPGSPITVTVGDGGSGGFSWNSSSQRGNPGTDSIFSTITATGGGGGGAHGGSDGRTNGTTGGSGGGGGSSTGSAGNTPSTTPSQGNSGGTGDGNNGGGGGGSSANGETRVAGVRGGNGGNGTSSSISGTLVTYAGGGGGGTRSGNGTGGTGGSGGGGNGGTTDLSRTSTHGGTNTGGGGGGGGHNGSGAGAVQSGSNGGSGIVIVRYSGAQKATGGTVTSVGGYTIHTFTTSGTFTPTWRDLTLNGNTGTLINGPTYSTSNSGSLSFDGVDDRVECGTFSLSYLTISTWVYKTSSATNQGICRKQNGWAVSQYNGTLQVAPGTSWTFYNTGYTIPLNTWVNIVYTYSGTGTTGSQTVYVNGSNIYSSSAGSGAISANSNPVRIGYDDNVWFWGGRIAQTQIYNRALTENEVKQNYNSLKGRFVPDGSSADKAAPSASHLVSLGLTTDGVYWINLPTAGPTQIYCILNPAYDGGGWMMAMKATTGTTFNYSANYWTTANTLNPTENNRNNGDAKFNSMNYFEAKDMMAIWPDITNGGSIPSSTLGWTWLQNNFNDGTRITPISFFGITYPTMNFGGSGKFIQDAKTYSGWASGVFSSQPDIRFYGFNYANNTTYFGSSNAKVRWGFGWNENGEGLYPSSDVGSVKGSNDVSGGIGMDSGHGSYSAGDRINCCNDTTGINRSARVEVYIR